MCLFHSLFQIISAAMRRWHTRNFQNCWICYAANIWMFDASTQRVHQKGFLNCSLTLTTTDDNTSDIKVGKNCLNFNLFRESPLDNVTRRKISLRSIVCHHYLLVKSSFSKEDDKISFYVSTWFSFLFFSLCLITKSRWSIVNYRFV